MARYFESSFSVLGQSCHYTKSKYASSEWAAIAPHGLGYFVPGDEWMTGHNNNYEESVSLGKHAGTALADRLGSLIAAGSAR